MKQVHTAATTILHASTMLAVTLLIACMLMALSAALAADALDLVAWLS